MVDSLTSSLKEQTINNIYIFCFLTALKPEKKRFLEVLVRAVMKNIQHKIKKKRTFGKLLSSE